jgi:sugar phosphate isomerase/epimerase
MREVLADGQRSATGREPVIIIATCWTTAGNVRPGDSSEVSPWLFEDRVKAVAEAGFTGFGLLHADVVATRDRIGYPAMRSILADNGIAVVELEVITNWFTDDARRDQFEDQWRDFAQAAETLNARHIKAVGDMSADPWPLALLADKFADLCHRAEDVGTAIVLDRRFAYRARGREWRTSRTTAP